MRKGQVWEQVLQNRKRMLRECPHVQFQLTPAVSILNVLYLPEFYRSWVKQKLIQPQEINLYMVYEPDFYNIQRLPDAFKRKVERLYADFLSETVSQFRGKTRQFVTDQFNQVIQHMNQRVPYQPNIDSYNGENFFSYNQKLDEIRGEDFAATFPEIAELFR